MIFITRGPEPAFLRDPGGKWQVETGEAIDHYTNGTATESFKFKTYSDTALKDELKAIFTKCAYCESSYGAVFDGDVEHFRPKGQVSEKSPKTPGYYWLSNDWDNLFLSCQHCNQRRRHVLFGETTLEAFGKLDQFPLSDETVRVHGHATSLQHEENVRLLVNPCKDKPEEHFEYEKTEGVIMPVSEMGRCTVEVCALQRPLLVQERKKQLILLFRQMVIVKRELERFNADQTEGQKQIFETELDHLIEFTNSGSIYAGMCRYFVKQFLDENGIGP